MGNSNAIVYRALICSAGLSSAIRHLAAAPARAAPP